MWWHEFIINKYATPVTSKFWNSTLGLILSISLLAGGAQFAAGSQDEEPLIIGSVKWAIYDGASTQPLSIHEKSLQASDVKMRLFGERMVDKKIELGEHFSFSLADAINRDIAPRVLSDGRKIDDDGYVIIQESSSKPDSAKNEEQCGFGLTGERDDVPTFSWDWFEVDKPGHATKLQELGALSFDTKKTPNGTEINQMVFLTDVSIRVSRQSDTDPYKPTWRIKIFKGSSIRWPASSGSPVQDKERKE